MDFIGRLPKSEGRDTILVVVDRLSKYAHFCTFAHSFLTKQVAELFVREIVRVHGLPRFIVSDHDSIFMWSVWREIFKLQGTKLHTNSTYHPESNGQTEVVNWGWKPTYSASQVQSQSCGQSFFRGLNIGSILPSMLPLNSLHFAWSMAKILRCSTVFKMFRPWMKKLLSNCASRMLCWMN